MMKLFSPIPSVIRQNRYLQVLAVVCALWLAIEIIARLGAEILWFQEVGYLPMYLLRLKTQGGLGIVVFTIAAIYLLGNLALAQRWSVPAIVERDRQKLRFLKLRWLLTLTLSLSFLLGVLSIHYLQSATAVWHFDPNSPSIAPSAPILWRSSIIWQLVKQLFSPSWRSVAVGAIVVFSPFYPRLVLTSISIVMTLSISWVVSRQWMRVLPYFQPTAFNLADPVFGQDISTYIFSLPVAQLWEFALMGICLTGLITVTMTYLLAGDSLSNGRFFGFSRSQQRHLDGLGTAVMLVISFSYWLNCYELLYSPRGVSFGASYTDIHVQLPVDRVFSILALAIAGYLFWRFVSFPRKIDVKPLLTILLLYLGLAIGANTGLPMLIQALVVQPNELARETPYLQRTIAFTRQAFGLENIETTTFNPQATLSAADIQANDLTIRNIRLWDKEPLLATNRQLQQIRLYYRFPDANIDRYTFTEPPTSPTQKSTSTQQQVLIAARELDYTAVPKQAQTWVNKHLIYTHGYGFTLSPVNRVAPGGLPEYLVKDIGMTAKGALTTANASVRANIPIGQPRIYYGENTNAYIMTNTKVKELDYPSGDENVYNIYDGRGGIDLNSVGRKFLFAKYLNDWRMLITPEFLPKTKLLFRRNLNQRIRSIAPFLRFDLDPYLVAANTANRSADSQDPSYLYWIVDAYTTSDRYPYSDVGKEGINYIRNSVKVVVDAYHGSVKFYITDPSDPIVTTWAKIFPDLFEPLSAMPPNLRRHIRYPTDLFKIQSERLRTYHMTDPQVFYNREDQWQIPTEVYGDKPRLVEPYHLITSLPSLPFEEFILFLPYTPQQRTNLIAWLAARSDGENYGKLLLYTFPKQRQIYGPEQIEARINQDPVISQQISLWNRQGSRVIQGNLLIVPIEQSLLYVEPLYLASTQNQLPTLVRVIVAYENRIVMAQTLQQALTAIFKSSAPAPPPIIRPVEPIQP